MQKRNILEYLEAAVRRFPDKCAISSPELSLSFSDIEKKARAIGSHLIKSGYQRMAVAVLMDKHPDTVCAFFGALYAGCFYVCIDSDMPDSRMLEIVDSSRASVVIFQEKNRKRAARLSGRAEIICFDDIKNGEIDMQALDKVRDRAIDTDPAYIVFTSGSSGMPHGVCASHRSVIDYAEALCSVLPFNKDTVFGNQAPLYYDAPLKELLPMLALGASVVLIPRELFMFPLKLCEFIKEQGINTLCWAASALTLVSSLGALEQSDMSQLTAVCFGSEVFPSNELKKWRSACPNATFINLYGPTEATGMSCYHILDGEHMPCEPIPIGRPFPNTEILLITDDEKRAEGGDIGEIYIRGGGVTLGYFGDRESTEASYVQNPLNKNYPETVYKTGDMARYNEHGELIYLGRRDRQIKIRGRRIEPYEIEAAACSCRGISAAAVIFDRERASLILFYVGESDERMLGRLLSLILPRYMLPSVYIRLERMPQLENGKLDRSRLCEMLDEKKQERIV